jgi:hypothetical protein
METRVKKRTHTRRIILHCSATSKQWARNKPMDLILSEIRHWHVNDNGWSDVGYHWLIGPTGEVVTGRDETLMGAHTKAHNSDSIGICLIGGRGSGDTDAPEDHFTPAQLAALVELVADIERRYPGVQTVHGHNEFARRACPGFRVADHWERVKRQYGRTTPKSKPTPWWVRLINALWRS